VFSYEEIPGRVEDSGLDYGIEDCGGYFLATTSGDVEVDSFGNLLDAIFTHENWNSDTPYITDLSDLNAGLVTANGVRRIAQITRDRRSRYGATKSAIVAPRDLEYGLSRMWLVFVDDEENVDTSIFRTREEAIAWVTA